MVRVLVLDMAMAITSDTLTQVTDVFKLEDYQAALDKMNSRGALKIAIRP